MKKSRSGTGPRSVNIYWPGHTFYYVHSLAIFFIASASFDLAMKLWNTKSHKKIGQIKGHSLMHGLYLLIVIDGQTRRRTDLDRPGPRNSDFLQVATLILLRATISNDYADSPTSCQLNSKMTCQE
ncbi:hypothetical protein BDR07DRAFT_308758 [Suillus spraguei]|nr:hypothetical protein BDR07DRAFT_308758 [Suillus spraguei]